MNTYKVPALCQVTGGQKTQPQPWTDMETATLPYILGNTNNEIRTEVLLEDRGQVPKSAQVNSTRLQNRWHLNCIFNFKLTSYFRANQNTSQNTQAHVFLSSILPPFFLSATFPWNTRLFTAWTTLVADRIFSNIQFSPLLIHNEGTRVHCSP